MSWWKGFTGGSGSSSKQGRSGAASSASKAGMQSKQTKPSSSKAGMQSKQGRSGAASSASKAGMQNKQTKKTITPPKDDFGGSREGYIAGSGSTIGADAPSDFTEKEKKSFKLAQDEKVIKAYSEGRIDKVPDDYEFHKDTKNKEIADEKFTEFLEDVPKKSSIPMPAQVALLKKWLVDPTPDMFTDPNSLAILKYGILKNPEDYVDYFKKWKDVIGEGLGSIYPTYGEGAVSEDFERFKNAIESASIPQGSAAQKRYAPWDYYDQDLYYDKGTGFHDEYGKKMSEYDLAMQDYPGFLSDIGLKPLSSRFGTSMDNLADIASVPLDSIPYDEKGKEFRKRVIAAREVISRQKDRQGGGGGGGGAGIPSIPQGQPQSAISSQYSNIPEQYQGFFDSPFNKPVAGGMAVTPVQLPDGSVIQFGDTGSAGQFEQYLDSMGVNWSRPGTVQQVKQTPATGIPSLTPTTTTFAASPFDYSQLGPHFGPQYSGHYSHWGTPSYANGGIVSKARPQQYIEWKKIIKTFPGIR